MRSTPLEALITAVPGASRRRSSGSISTGATGDSRVSSDVAAALGIELAAAVISVNDDEPLVEVIVPNDARDPDRLPSVLLGSTTGLSLEDSLRGPVEQQTSHAIGFLQQLVAFIETHGNHGNDGTMAAARLLIGYLALVHEQRRKTGSRGVARVRHRVSRWQGCYLHLPWEDWRSGRPAVIDDVILPRLAHWSRENGVHAKRQLASKAALSRLQSDRVMRAHLAFASPGAAWDEEKVLTRFDLLAEAGLISEARAAGVVSGARPGRGSASVVSADAALGRTMVPGHRRILAAGLGRLRMDLKLRPVVFELMDAEFSLYELQRTVEVIRGPNLHKQNFRRLIETAGLVEPTGRMKSHTGGRPAKLYRFRREILLERPALGVKLRN